MIDKLKLVPDEEFKTAAEIGLAAASLGAMVRRGLVEATNTSPKKYRKSDPARIKIYSLLEENKTDYFTLRKAGEKIGMLCSYKNNTVLDCFDKPYDLTNVNYIKIKTKEFYL